MRRRKWLGWCGVLAALVCLLAAAECRSAPGALRLSMLPRYATEEIHRRCVPLAAYLEKALDRPVEVVLFSSFAQYLKQLQGGTIDIGFENPYIYVLASRHHEVVAMAVTPDGGDRFRGIIVTRADSPLRTVADLRGKTISIVGFTSGGGYLSQRLFLLEQGLDPVRACRLVEAAENKQENVVFEVLAGDADAGFVRESALQRLRPYVPAGAVRVLTETAWLPNWALSVRRDLDPDIRAAVRQAVLRLPTGDQVLEAMRIRRFKPAADADYDSVRQAAAGSATTAPLP